MGYTLEHGPYIVNEGSTNMTENPNSWNKNATVFYIESPAGVGFSLCGDDKECLYNDTNQAEDNLVAVLSIFKDKFPALRNNSLWLSGQKHGGIVVPYLMAALDLWSVNAKSEDPDAWVPNLKG
jgi:carboxypeptidase C (cathepsin A)